MSDLQREANSFLTDVFRPRVELRTVFTDTGADEVNAVTETTMAAGSGMVETATAQVLQQLIARFKLKERGDYDRPQLPRGARPRHHRDRAHRRYHFLSDCLTDRLHVATGGTPGLYPGFFLAPRPRP